MVSSILSAQQNANHSEHDHVLWTIEGMKEEAAYIN